MGVLLSLVYARLIVHFSYATRIGAHLFRILATSAGAADQL
jgi:hypothetical protein